MLSFLWADLGPPRSPLLQRQGTIRFRGSISKQNSLETEGSVAQVVYENEDMEANGTGEPYVFV